MKVDTLLKGANSSLTKFGDRVLYAYKKGIYAYDTLSQTFTRDAILSELYSEENYSSGHIITNETGDRCWIFTRNNIIIVSSDGLMNRPRVSKLPLSIGIRGDVVEYENILELAGDNETLFGTNFGYIKLGLDELKINDFQVAIDGITVRDIRKGTTQKVAIKDRSSKNFTSEQNSLSFSYHAPEYYEHLQTFYQYQFIGLYDHWSSWSTQAQAEFENLDPGDYVFKVRARIGEQISENVASYSFSISPPWYLSRLWFSIYIIALVLLFVGLHSLYTNYYQRRQNILLEENQKELELERLRSEQEIIRIKNEQLKKNYKDKSNELAASAMNIVRKNELLMEIKEKLKEVTDRKAIGSVLKVIDKNLSHEENWHLFKEAFDNADREFFKNIKALHPDLSPNDLKLCAYLRLNLSSKEIAPLFNISSRSVEIKRYRLRKKLGLDSNENLASYILNI
jgi:DNA-binding CsgD family transcriptional regulator/cell division protein FtsB